MENEKGFYHPSRGYWQTTGQPTPSAIKKYPSGYAEVPVQPDENYQWLFDDDQDWSVGEWVYVAPPFDAAAISTECRTRIITVLDTYTVQNIQGAYMTGDLTDEQKVIFKAGRDWVAAMQDACRISIVNQSDPIWPPVPDGVVDLAELF